MLDAGGQFRTMRHLSPVHLTDGAFSHREAWACGWPTHGAYAAARLREPEAAALVSGVPFDCVHLRLPRPPRCLRHGLGRDAPRRPAAARAPGLVLTDAYEGGHLDHDAAAFACWACLLAGGGSSGLAHTLRICSLTLDWREPASSLGSEPGEETHAALREVPVGRGKVYM